MLHQPKNITTTYNELVVYYCNSTTAYQFLQHTAINSSNTSLYDPALARMLSPDNYVPNPHNPQAYNRYSYCLNNPLIYTEPDGEFIQYIIGAVIGGFGGYMMADNLRYKGWDKFWYTLGRSAIGAATAGIGTSVTSSAGIVAGGIAGGVVSGAGFGTMGGYAAGLRGQDLFNAGFTGMFRGAIAGGMGSIVGGAIGGGWGAIAGGATSNLTGLLLANDFSFQDVNWTSVGISGATSLGIYHLSSYVNWRSEVKNQNFYGRSIKYNQYLRMQASYTRGKFWGSERAGGGFWLTKNGISRQGVSYDPEHGNVVRFDFSQKPSDAWATFHPHPYNENQVVGDNLWHSSYDITNVGTTNFSSLIINKLGAELVTPISTNQINFWNYGKPYYIYNYPW
ncbi:MAG: hypothetical protein HPY79_02960 [Bacteroidales bacterium]|nr:hypothetical protein [Bacteroidales bacterium]